MLIILTGLSGSGKTATGKHLAKIINGQFIDLDTQIQKITNKTIAKLFEYYGEKNFRKIESFILEHILSLSYDKLVLSLGGGAFINDKNRSLCLEKGIVVWLNTSIAIINNRLTKDLENRPLLNKHHNIFLALCDLLKDRAPYYAQANHILHITNKRLKPLAIAEQVINVIQMK